MDLLVFLSLGSLFLAGGSMIGNVYRHKRKGTRYVVVEVANEHSDDPVLWPVLVVYVDENRKTWARPKAEFDKNFELAF